MLQGNHNNRVAARCAPGIRPVKVGRFLYFGTRCEFMDYISIAEAAAKWGITRRRGQALCNEGRIPANEVRQSLRCFYYSMAASRSHSFFSFSDSGRGITFSLVRAAKDTSPHTPAVPQ